MSKRIIIVDDHERVRKLVRDFIEQDASLSVCGEISNGFEAVQKAQMLRPDLIILDLLMPDMNGIAAARLLKKLLPDTPILLLTLHDGAVRGCGIPEVDAVVAKSAPLPVLMEAVQALLDPSPRGLILDCGDQQLV